MSGPIFFSLLYNIDPMLWPEILENVVFFIFSIWKAIQKCFVLLPICQVMVNRMFVPFSCEFKFSASFSVVLYTPSLCAHPPSLYISMLFRLLLLCFSLLLLTPM